MTLAPKAVKLLGTHAAMETSMEMIQAILATGVILVGLMVLGLVMQTIHQVRVAKLLTRVETLEARILARLLMEAETQTAMTGTAVTLEDLIQRDLMETMGETAPMTDRGVTKLVEEMTTTMATETPVDLTLLTPATDKEILAILETRATAVQKGTPLPTMVRAETTTKPATKTTAKETVKDGETK
jgi:hypothetical protein